jgi:hypothetical protein
MCGQDTYQLYRYPKACRACRCPRRIASASVKPSPEWPKGARPFRDPSPASLYLLQQPSGMFCLHGRTQPILKPAEASVDPVHEFVFFDAEGDSRTSTTSRLSFPALATVVLRPFFRALRGICANHFSSGIRGLDHDFKFRAVRPYRPARGNWSAMSTASSVRGSVV